MATNDLLRDDTAIDRFEAAVSFSAALSACCAVTVFVAQAALFAARGVWFSSFCSIYDELNGAALCSQASAVNTPLTQAVGASNLLMLMLALTALCVFGSSLIRFYKTWRDTPPLRPRGSGVPGAQRGV